MSLYTYEIIKLHPNKTAAEAADVLGFAISKNLTFGEAFEQHENRFITTDNVPYYDPENDLMLISKQFPDIQFTLIGYDRESGEPVQEHYMNGSPFYNDFTVIRYGQNYCGRDGKAAV